ncbi:hypothetical protein DEU56DRAFT_764119 [Suillus clintonianus]|uniref:uncharacterized protein n=1 Tax=Suillus clintonianus TaxID=1904413 RepID=UPI001B86A7CA|nr:uncharacterized protein DEU56DRAFT_764119 [Suillus clintonianus]KAG2157351.1 hypothetical protein DEU56DRAFT_764119 [Suillus clintonianus]
MRSTLLFARYILFGLFVVCNAIICSIAVWNHSLVQANGGQTLQVDAYLIFLGAFCLAFIFPIIFADLLCTDPLSGRVWFECVWVALIWLMQLAGAAAVTAIAPQAQCIAQAALANGNACSSTHVLLAFTWICTIILLLYLLLLVVTAITTQRIDPGVWHHNVRYLRIETTRQCLPSAQNSPTTPRFKVRGTSEAHKPRSLRPAPYPIYGHRAGLDSEYEIEHYRPYVPQQTTVDSALSLPEAIPAPTVSYPSPALVYSQRIRGLIPPETGAPPTPRLDTSIAYSNSVKSSTPAQQTRASLSSPSPSPPSSSPFDWPRANVMEQPVKAKRKPPPSAFEFPRGSAQVPSELPGNLPTDSLSHPRTRRPSGPRVRPPSADETQHSAPYLARPMY